MNLSPLDIFWGKSSLVIGTCVGSHYVITLSGTTLLTSRTDDVRYVLLLDVWKVLRITSYIQCAMITVRVYFFLMNIRFIHVPKLQQLAGLLKDNICL